MGIGNVTAAIAAAVAGLRLITPHGDWKLDRWRVGSDESGALITPHGDWKPEVFPAAFGPITSTSLPLMGIGNAPGRHDVDDDPHLITPHGDWKLDVDRLWFTGSDLRSLPLMGIGNPPRLRRNHAQRVLITPHGDWKLLLAHLVAESDPRLITPHGDWKPLGQVGVCTDYSGSLPLMGIGNPAPGGAPTPAPRLITPHGDWKLRQSRERSRQRTRAHYPSWGLETSVGLSAMRPACRNSLPLMGIGNRSEAGPSPQSCATTHYPSWGLETADKHVFLALDEFLITPHGDWKRSHRNSSRRLSRAHYPSWGLET